MMNPPPNSRKTRLQAQAQAQNLRELKIARKPGFVPNSNGDPDSGLDAIGTYGRGIDVA
jgi:hypothetical protein